MKKRFKHDNLNIFIENLKTLFPMDFPTIEKGLRRERPTTFRLNSSKTSIETVKKDLNNEGFEFISGPFKNSYILTKIPDGKYISDTNSFKNADIYIQELASMVPPLVLNPKQDEKILDMASAPGSKTTQMVDMTNDKAEILALEKHPIRIQTLQHNIKQFGAESVQVLLTNGIKFDMRYPQFKEFFDRILVDAPCSSEGRFNLNDPKSYKFWNIHKRKDMTKIQKGLIIAGIRMLKPGGTLVYSTCTFGIEENELVLEWLLQKYPDLKVEKIDTSENGINIKNVKKGFTKTPEGKDLNKQIANSIRIMPNENFGGFFVAKITK